MTLKSDFVIREMRECDIDEIDKLEKLSFAVPWSREAIAGELKNPLARFFVCLKGGALLGYCGTHTLLGVMSIVSIASNPRSRRTGVAQAMLSHLLEIAERESLEAVILEVRESNTAARAFYEKNGFEHVGKRPRYYERPVEDALLMTLFLKKSEEN